MNFLNFTKYLFANIYEKIHYYCVVHEHNDETNRRQLREIPSINLNKLAYKQSSHFANIHFLRECITSRYNPNIQDTRGVSTYRKINNDQKHVIFEFANIERKHKEQPVNHHILNSWLNLNRKSNSNINSHFTYETQNTHKIISPFTAKAVNISKNDNSRNHIMAKQIVPIIDIKSTEKRNSELLTYREKFSFLNNESVLSISPKSRDKLLESKKKLHNDWMSVNMLLLSACHDRTIQKTKASIEMLTFYTDETYFKQIDTKFHIIEEGSFGRVYKGRYNNYDVAVKIPNLNTMKSDPLGVTDRILREWRLLAKINHPNIIGFKGGIILPNKHIWLITDFIRGCDLHSLNYKYKYKIPTEKAIKMIKQLIRALNFLHTPIKEKGIIIHRDIKPENIIIDHYNWDIYLCDFGDAEEFGSGNKRRLSGATWLYSPIELLDADPLGNHISIQSVSQYNEKWDIWSLGCVLQEFFGNSNPFEYIVDFADSSNIIYSKLVEAVRENKYIPNIPTDIHPKIRKVIEMCLQPDPRLRPSAKTILRMIDGII